MRYMATVKYGNLLQPYVYFNQNLKDLKQAVNTAVGGQPSSIGIEVKIIDLEKNEFLERAARPGVPVLEYFPL